MATGKFITLEGIEGVGKSTQLEYVANYIASKKIEVITTREPGGTDIGEAIRTILLDNGYDEMSDDTELLLMFAARAQHLNQVIHPALDKGQWVVCDRFTDATYAYQGGGRGIDRSRIETLETWTQGSLRPDLTLLFDAPIEVGLSRAKNRGAGHADRFESEEIAFYRRVQSCYLDRARKDPERYRVVDSSRPIDRVRTTLQEILDNFDI